MMENSIRSIDEKQTKYRQYDSGLEEVRSDHGKYYIINMNAIFDDTAIEKVYISRDCILGIYRFFLEFLKSNNKTNETGCFIIGRWEEASSNTYNISLEEVIEPGNDAIYGEYELDFGTQIGIGLESAIIDIRQTTHKDYVQTCWIHSHPGLGLFLSNHDLVVQSQLVYSEHPTRMLAMVIDSNTESLDTALFTAKRSGEMNNKEDMNLILSFEKISQWAKGIQSEQTEEIEKNINVCDFNTFDFYEHISNTPNIGISKFLFSGSAIIDMDYITTSDAQGLKGYFYGRMLHKQNYSSQNQALIETFHTAKLENGEEPIGCLLVLHQFNYQSTIAKYESIIGRYDFFVVYNPWQDDLKIIARSLDGRYLIDAEHDLIPLQMMEVRKWTRRRRD